jgi:hypothetical protein
MALARFFFPGGANSETSAGGGHQGADAEAGDEPQQPETRGGGHHRGHAHADGEPRVGGEHHLPPADDVTDRSREQCTDQDAD